MTYKSSGKLIIKECEECHIRLNGKPIYTTIETKPRRLCNICMAKWLGVNEFP